MLIQAPRLMQKTSAHTPACSEGWQHRRKTLAAQLLVSLPIRQFWTWSVPSFRQRVLSSCEWLFQLPHHRYLTELPQQLHGHVIWHRFSCKAMPVSTNPIIDKNTLSDTVNVQLHNYISRCPIVEYTHEHHTDTGTDTHRHTHTHTSD